MATTKDVIGTISVRINAITTDLDKGMTRANRRLDAFSKAATRMGRTLTRRVTLPIVALGVAATKMAVTFDEEMTKIITLVGVADEQVNEWRKSILELAPAVGKGPAELARAMFVVTSAGERGADALVIVEQAAKAAALGLGDTAVTARAVTAAMQAYREQGLSASRATEILVATVREGNLEAESLAGSLGRVIGIASQVGVSFEQVGGFIATFTRLGVSAEEATTALRQILTLLLKPTRQSEQALKAAGLSAEELRRSVGEQGLAGTLRLLVERFKGQEEILAQVIPNVRALSGVMGTAGSQGEQFVKINESIANSLGIVEEGFRRVQETPAQQWKVFTAEAAVMSIEIGNKLIPTFLRVINSASDIVNKFTSMSDRTQTSIIRFAGLAAIAGPLALAIGTVTKAIVFLNSVILIPLFRAVSVSFVTWAATALPAATATTTMGRAMTFATAQAVRLKAAMIALQASAAFLIAGAAVIAGGFILIANEAMKAKKAIIELQEVQIREAGRIGASIQAWQDRLKSLREGSQELFDDFTARAKFFRTDVGGNLTVLQSWTKAWDELRREGVTAFQDVAEASNNAADNMQAGFDTAAATTVKTIGDVAGEMQDALMRATVSADVFGESFDFAEAQINIVSKAIEDFIDAGAQANTVIDASGMTLEQLVERQQELQAILAAVTTEQKELNEIERQAKIVIESIQTPLEKNLLTLGLLDILLEKEKITWEQYTLAVEQANEALERANTEGIKAATVAETAAKRIDQSLVNSLASVIDRSRTAGEAFAAFASTVISEMAKLAALGAFNFLFPTGIGGFFGKILGFQEGGFIHQGQPAIVGESGPELFVPQASGTIVSNEQSMSKNITVNVYPRPLTMGEEDAWARKLKTVLERV